MLALVGFLVRQCHCHGQLERQLFWGLHLQCPLELGPGEMQAEELLRVHCHVDLLGGENLHWMTGRNYLGWMSWVGLTRRRRTPGR